MISFYGICLRFFFKYDWIERYLISLSSIEVTATTKIKKKCVDGYCCCCCDCGGDCTSCG